MSAAPHGRTSANTQKHPHMRRIISPPPAWLTLAVISSPAFSANVTSMTKVSRITSLPSRPDGLIGMHRAESRSGRRPANGLPAARNGASWEPNYKRRLQFLHPSFSIIFFPSSPSHLYCHQSFHRIQPRSSCIAPSVTARLLTSSSPWQPTALLTVQRPDKAHPGCDGSGVLFSLVGMLTAHAAIQVSSLGQQHEPGQKCCLGQSARQSRSKARDAMLTTPCSRHQSKNRRILSRHTIIVSDQRVQDRATVVLGYPGTLQFKGMLDPGKLRGESCDTLDVQSSTRHSSSERFHCRHLSPSNRGCRSVGLHQRATTGPVPTPTFRQGRD